MLYSRSLGGADNSIFVLRGNYGICVTTRLVSAYYCLISCLTA